MRSPGSLAQHIFTGSITWRSFSKVFPDRKGEVIFRKGRRSMSQTINMQAPPIAGEWVRVASLAELQTEGRLTVLARHHVVALFASNGQVYAVDNRCPH